MKALHRLALVAVVALVALALGVAPAVAQSPEAILDLQFPRSGAVGEELPLRARLTGADGEPIPGAEIGFFSLAEFAGASGEIELGRATTDETGLATLAYVPRREGELKIAVRLPAGDGHGAATAMAAVTVQPGPSVYEESAGVRVPGVNVWLLVGVLGAVWCTYVTVMVLLAIIARRGALLASREQGGGS